MNIINDIEKLLMCPYNPAHVIRANRMEMHLSKCRKSNLDKILIPCDFNSTHKIPQPELQYHHERCPDRKVIEIQVFQESVVNSIAPPLKIPPSCPPEDESWSSNEVKSYNPEEDCDKTGKLWNINGGTRSEKIALRNINKQYMQNAPQSAPRIHHFTNAEIETLPPIPSYSQKTRIEDSSRTVHEMMEKLQIKPKTVVVPRKEEQTINRKEEVEKNRREEEWTKIEGKQKKGNKTSQYYN